MKNHIMTSFFVLLVCVLGQTVLAQTFSVQGVLRDPLGKTVKDGSYNVTFRLYNANTAGTKLWEETQSSLQVLHGVITAELGTVTSLSTVPFDKTYYLGVSVDGGQELEPRFKLTKTPAAMSVQGTDNVFPSHGNIGAGTTSPAAGLHIVTNASGDDLLKIESSASGGGFIKVLADGKMGVNVSAPQQALDIDGNLKMRTGGIIFDDGSILSTAKSSGSAAAITNDVSALIGADADDNSSGEIQFLVGSTTKMVLKNDGKVGIGKTSPSYPLDVSGDIQSGGYFRGSGYYLTGLNASNISYGTLSSSRLDTDLQDLADGTLSGSKVGSGISASNITTGTLSKFRLDSDLQDLADGSLSGSKVGSGISASNITTGTLSNSRLDADLQDLADGMLSDSKLESTIDRTNFSASGWMEASKFYDDDNNYYADLNSGGKLGGKWGIGQQYNNTAFNVNSGLAILLNVEDDAGNHKFQVTPEGVWGLNFSQASSIRWKKDVKLLKNSLTSLMKLQGVSYLPKEADKGAKRKIGFIAEEVGKVYPELVNYEKNGVDARGLEYAQITAVLVEAVKELKAELDARDDLINELSKRVEALEKR